MKETQFINLCKLRRFKDVKLAIYNKAIDPSFANNYPVRYASENNLLSILTILLNDKRVDPSVYSNESLITASSYGHIDIVILLLQDPRVNPTDQNNKAVINAFLNKESDIVNILFTQSLVRKPLKNDNIEMFKKIMLNLKSINIETYNEIIKEDMQPKIMNF